MLRHIYKTRGRMTWWLIVALAAITFVGLSLWASTDLFAQDPAAPSKFVHCYEVIQHEDGRIGYIGHPPMAQKFQADPGEQHVASRCFHTWAEAAFFITGGEVRLPANATQKDYERATQEFSAKVYAEQQKAQQQP